MFTIFCLQFQQNISEDYSWPSLIHNLCVLCLGLTLEMEQYIGCEISKVPLSNIAQRIMTALQSIPVEAQTNRENNQSE